MKDEIADHLSKIVERERVRLLHLDDSIVLHQPAAEKWSVKQIVGHLIDSAANNHQRFIRVQDSTPLNLPGYEQEFWVEANRYQDCSWVDLVMLWANYNRHLVHVIRYVPSENLQNKCTIAAGEPVTLEFLIADYIRHMLHHLKQIHETQAAD